MQIHIVSYSNRFFISKSITYIHFYRVDLHSKCLSETIKRTLEEALMVLRTGEKNRRALILCILMVLMNAWGMVIYGINVDGCWSLYGM